MVPGTGETILVCNHLLPVTGTVKHRKQKALRLQGFLREEEKKEEIGYQIGCKMPLVYGRVLGPSNRTCVLFSRLHVFKFSTEQINRQTRTAKNLQMHKCNA